MKGSIAYDRKRGQFVVDTASHVVLRLKRWFGSVGKKGGRQVKSGLSRIRISATPETARELQVFAQLFPMELCPELKRLAKQHVKTTKLVDELLTGHRPPPEFDLAVPLREYQRIATAITLQTGSLLLADEAGIGKTASAIGLFTDPKTLPALVVTLTHLPTQWEREINRFAPDLKTHVIQGTTPYDLTRPRPRKGMRGHAIRQLALIQEAFPDVIITSYSKLRTWAPTLGPLVNSVVFDECQELRRSGSSPGLNRGAERSFKYAGAETVAKGKRVRIGLSATPVYNYGSEMFSILNVLNPGALGTWSEFREEWCTGWDDKHPIKNPKAFGSYLKDSGLMLRRTRSDVGRELPAITKVPHHIDADTSILDRAAGEAMELARIILAQSETNKGDRMNAAGQLDVKLRQATGIAKAPYVAAFVQLLVESGEKVLLYGWHREVYGIWQDLLKDLKPAMYTGTETPQQKERARDAFVKGDARVLLMSLRSGAGLDGLQHCCRTVVHGELDWSPAVHHQCDGRVHRDGQPDPVMAYYLYADHGSDPIVLDILGVKRQQATGVINPDAPLVEKLQVDPGHIRRLAEQYMRQRGQAA
jgi:SNF2 family DNA or RNA helicase